jgi:hypothetical protein
MYIRRIAALLVLVPAALWAADPFVGTWKLNVAKSHYTTGTPPKEQTLTISESGGDQDTTVSLTTADGNTITYRFTAPAKGGDGKVVQPGGGFDAVHLNRIKANTRETHFSKSGKMVRTARITVNKDGKTMHGTIKGTDAQGKPIAATVVFEKQ